MHAGEDGGRSLLRLLKFTALDVINQDSLPLCPTCLVALTAEKLGNGFEGVSSERREPKAISSPSLSSAFIFVFKWLGLLTHTHFLRDIQLNFMSVLYASLLLEAVTINLCFQKESIGS